MAGLTAKQRSVIQKALRLATDLGATDDEAIAAASAAVRLLRKAGSSFEDVFTESVWDDPDPPMGWPQPKAGAPPEPDPYDGFEDDFPPSNPPADNFLWSKEKLTFGKYKGYTIVEVLAIDPRYLAWVMEHFEDCSQLWAIKDALQWHNQQQ